MCTLECFSAVKKNEILKFALKYVKLENFILSEVITPRKINITFSLQSELPNSKSSDMGIQPGVTAKLKKIKMERGQYNREGESKVQEI